MRNRDERTRRGLAAYLRVVALVMLPLLASLLLAHEETGLAGKWKMVSVTPNGDSLNWLLRIKHEDAGWSAAVSTGPGEEAAAKEVKVDGNSFRMKTPYNGEYYDVELKLVGDKLTGKWSGNGDSGSTSGTRDADSATQ